MADYEPTGRAGAAIAAMRADPDPRRFWSTSQLAAAINCNTSVLAATMARAVEAGIVHYRSEGWGRSEYRLVPFDAPSAPMLGPTTANGWQPPQMVAPRAGSDVKLPKTAVSSSAQAAEVPVFLKIGPEPEPLAPSMKALLADVDAGVGAPEGWTEPAAADPEPEPTEPDAWFSARTGCVVLTGIELDEDGSITLLPQLVRAIVHMAREGVR